MAAPPFRPSPEQQAVISAVLSGAPLIVTDSVAGAGKTSTLLGLAAAAPERSILQITYNASLKAEVRAKCRQQGATNVTIHTYHSLAVRWYDPTAYTDERIYKVLHAGGERAAPLRPIPAYDVVCIDETQDATPLYYSLVWRFLSDRQRRHPNARPPQLLVLGDRYQGVYAFKQADARFLTMARYVFHAPRSAAGRLPPVLLKMSVSYRVTRPIAAFVNRYMLRGDPRLSAVKSGPPVVYVRSESYTTVPKVFRIIKQALADGRVTPEDIFILAPSIKRQRSAVRILENYLVLHGVPCYAPLSDDCSLDDAVLAGKCVLTTLCQSKGRERPLTVLFGFDAGYFQYFERTADPQQCTPGLYVGATRASQQLIVVEDTQHGPLPFLRLDGIASDPDVLIVGDSFSAPELAPAPTLARDAPSPSTSDATDATDATDDSTDDDGIAPATGRAFHRTTVTDLTKFVQTEIVADISEQFPALFVCRAAPDPTRTADLPPKVQTAPNRYEEVSDLTGLALTAFWEYNETGRCTMDRIVREQADFGAPSDKIRSLIDQLPRAYTEPADFLRLSAVYQAYTQGYLFKTQQLTAYDWLRPADVALCIGHLSAVLRNDPPTAYEFPLLVPEPVPTAARRRRRETDDSADAADDDGIAETPFGRFRYTEPFIYASDAYGDVQISAIVDVLTPTTVYELKSVGALTIDHFIQVLLYAWIWRQAYEPTHGARRFVLLNLRTGERWELIATPADCDAIARRLIQNKYAPRPVLTDSEFLAESLCEARRHLEALSS